MAVKNSVTEPLVVKINNPYPSDTLFQVVLHCGSLAPDTELFIAYANVRNSGKPATAKGKQARQPGLKLAGAGGVARFPATLESGCGAGIPLDRSRIYRLSPGKIRQIPLPEILVATGTPAVLALKLAPAAKNGGNKPQQFDLVQMFNNQVVGGCTFLINPRKPTSGKPRPALPG